MVSTTIFTTTTIFPAVRGNPARTKFAAQNMHAPSGYMT